MSAPLLCLSCWAGDREPVSFRIYLTFEVDDLLRDSSFHFVYRLQILKAKIEEAMMYRLTEHVVSKDSA